MRRVARLLCAGLVGASVGCAWNLGNTRVETTVKVDEQAVDASLDATITKLQSELSRRRLQVEVTSEGDGRVRLTSATGTGDKFAVLLTRVRQADGKEQTRVRVEWDKAPDRDLWLGLIGALTVSVTKSPS